MCDSHGFNGNCCPSAQILQEKICGNLTGPLTNFIAWSASVTLNDYIQGTFEIFNAGPGIITAVINDNGTSAGSLTVPPGTSQSVSVNSPDSFQITDVPAGTTGKFCITLYKRILA